MQTPLTIISLHGGWRISSVLKGNCCSYTGLRKTPSIHMLSHSYLYLKFYGICPPLTSSGIRYTHACCTHIHAGKHINLFFLIPPWREGHKKAKSSESYKFTSPPPFIQSVNNC